MEQRLKELKPLHDEYLKLEQARDALRGIGRPARRGPGRPRGSTTRRRRRRRGGTRAEQALEVVRKSPGITVAELADRLGIAAARVDIPRVLQGSGRVPAALLGPTRAALADALASVFLATGVLAIAGVALALALEERPLRG
jgi:hypothetical protein